MAARFWVGGAGTWNTSSTTNWSATSGGAAGASAPTSSDDAVFDANSGLGTSGSTVTVAGSPTIANWSVSGRTAVGLTVFSLASGLTVTGNVTLSAGTNATMRTFVRSDTIGTPRTLTVNAFAAGAADIDFRDITIAGAAAPISGTRFGDCRGNSGVTFPAPKTVYWAIAASRNWGQSGGSGTWAFTQNGTLDPTAFPLAQDTAIIDSSANSLPSAGTVTVNAAYNIGTVDMSARTSNTMTLATGTQTPAIYGNWINGTGTTLTGTGAMTFAGRGSQTITSAGKTFTQAVTVDSPGGTVTLQDAFTCSAAVTNAVVLQSGTFDANNYNVSQTSSNGRFVSTGSAVRTVAIGAGTWTLAGTNGWNASTATNLTVTGTGTISLTSASAKTFAGGDIQTYPTINQGGTGTLTISGSNKFANITNTAIGRVQFTGGTTNEFGAFNLNGAAGTPLTLGSTNTTQAILKKPSAWLMGLLSTDAGNNTGLTFLATDGTMEYLTVSYINGQVAVVPISSDITETSSGLEAVAALLGASPVATEASSVFDALTQTIQASGYALEASAGADILSASGSFTSVVQEAGTGSESQTVGASAEVSEASAASETLVAYLTALLNTSEASASLDVLTATGSAYLTLNEASPATSSALADLSAAVTAQEFSAAVETLASGLTALRSLTESGSALDILALQANLTATLAEAGTAASSETAPLTASLDLVEMALAQAAQSVDAQLSGQMTEALNAEATQALLKYLQDPRYIVSALSRTYLALANQRNYTARPL